MESARAILKRCPTVLIAVLLALIGMDLSACSNAATHEVPAEAEHGAIADSAAPAADTSAGSGNAVVPAQGQPCAGTTVRPGQEVQAIVNALPAGATMCFQAGEYRISSQLTPKAGQRLIGAAGAILNGSVKLANPQPSGGSFVFSAQLPAAPRLFGYCAAATPNCNYEQDVFWDNHVMERVTSLGGLAPGKFFADYPNNKIYVRDNPTGHAVEQAVARWIVYSAAANVTVRGFIVEKSAGPAQDGAINGHANGATGWTVEYNEVRFNHGIGISVDASIIRNNYVHHNGQMGLGGESGTGGMVLDNEVAFNNAAGYNVGWEAGGSKFVANTNLVARGNYFHDNNGPGLWCDINCHHATFEGNAVANNKGGGIFYEISYNGVIRFNLVIDASTPTTGGFYDASNILVSASPDTEVYGNTSFGGNGIGILQQKRPDAPDPLGPHESKNVYIHDNIISTGSSTPLGFMAGLNQDIGDKGYFTAYNTRFVHNTYHLPNLTSLWFTWQDNYRSKAEWLGYGQDAAGIFDTNVTKPVVPPGPRVGPAAMK